ncbi:serine/threonine protein kinase [Cystobacter fuscus]|uniref:serine/threonine protein kinase n=1 Tax=Cystobacter fuscus TaxID=43 RepID=UPI002B2C0B2D|nr:protein kinase [Cystobacter fuscus]
MDVTEFHIPKGAILFSEGGVSYEFRKHLGEANHGLSLFLARKRTTEGPGGRVLLKAIGLPSGRAGARAFKARAKLEEEVTLSMALEHPGILRVLGMHKAEGAWYVIIEHPEANRLEDLLTLVMEGDGYFSPSFVLYVGAKVADALHHAHSRTDTNGRPLGIVHRAINPATVFIDWRGGVKLADFGLALSSLPGRIVSTVRRPQGDAYYSSPEMLMGVKPDARSDLFSLGLVMLESATGENLLYAPDGVPEKVKATLSRSKRARVERAIRRAKKAGCPDEVEGMIWRAATYTPEELDALTKELPQSLKVPLCKLLARSRSERFQTAAEVADALRGWLGSSFGAREAADELAKVAEEGADRLAELDMPRRKSARSA